MPFASRIGSRFRTRSALYAPFFRQFSRWFTRPHLVLGLWVFCLFNFPLLALALLTANLMLTLLLATCQLYAARLPFVMPAWRAEQNRPFVSIHVPIYNEPPDVVEQTLEQLTQLEYRNFEVIVLDNNTQDEAVWRPVEALCHQFGDRFRFRHVDKLEGYKAGALNVCLEMSAPEAEFVLVLDADYCVSPDILELALGYFTSADVALVQFPQAYSNAARPNRGLGDEFGHFFEVYMNMANIFGSVLSTGTVSVIRTSALREVGGWRGRSITEDVELGLNLLQAGYRGVYSDRVLGRGLMPSDEAALKKQRRRWVFGNAQTLKHFFVSDKAALSARQGLGVVVQLSAWFNCALLPLITLFAAGALYLMTLSPLQLGLLYLSLASLWLYLATKLIFFYLAQRRRGLGLVRTLLSFGSHLGLFWEGAYNWPAYLLGGELGFERTSKYLLPGSWAGALGPFLMTLSLLALAGGFYMQGTLLASVLTLGVVILPACRLLLREQLRQTFRLTQAVYRSFAQEVKRASKMSESLP